MTNPDKPTMRFGVLGPLAVEYDGRPLAMGSLKQRLVLAMLLMTANRVVSVDRLTDGLWGEEPPDGAMNTLQAHVSHLRRALAVGDVAILTQPPGYLLRVEPEQVDLLRFEQLTQRANDLADRGHAREALADLTGALQLWRGPALEDLGSSTFGDSARTFLEERRLGVLEDRLTLLGRLGRHQEQIESCEAVLAVHPLREAVWEKLIVALYRSGRQADALAKYRTCRELLQDELGVEPMPRLQQLEQQILNHDKRLQPARRTTTAMVIASPAQPAPSGQVTVLRARRLDAALVLGDGSTVPLAERTVLGRHRDCDITLEDPMVSRRHAEIRLTNGSHVLLDLSSSNGTWVAGRPVLQHPLRDGDTIKVGDQVLRYRTTDPSGG